MLHTIKKVEYLEQFKLKLIFKNNEQKIVDLKKYSKEGPKTVFYPFRDLDFFKSVKVDKHTGTIVWPNGVDLCPDVLYEIGVEAKKSAKKNHQQKKTKASSTSPRATSKIAAKSKTNQ